MKYSVIEDNKVKVTIPESIKRLKDSVLKNARERGIFADFKGTSVDPETGNQLHVDVMFPDEADPVEILKFCEEIEAEGEKMSA